MLVGLLWYLGVVNTTLSVSLPRSHKFSNELLNSGPGYAGLSNMVSCIMKRGPPSFMGLAMLVCAAWYLVVWKENFLLSWGTGYAGLSLCLDLTNFLGALWNWLCCSIQHAILYYERGSPFLHGTGYVGLSLCLNLTNFLTDRRTLELATLVCLFASISQIF